jgi:hypothetical protein
MKTFNVRCVTLEDFSDVHDLDVYEVDDRLLHSEYSYGTNDDTLIGYETLCDMCDINPLSTYSDIDLMVSLGS